MAHRSLMLVTVLAASVAMAEAPKRPPIVGVAHIALKTKDLAASRAFYSTNLGFAEAFSLDKPSGGLMLVYFKMNDHQYVEMFPELKGDEDRLMHIAFETTDIRQLRDYLEAKGVKVPAKLEPGLDGNLSMMLKDPEGHDVEFVQYMPGSLHTRNFGKALPGTRVSSSLSHVGFTVQDRAAEDRFFRDILGFVETWHGGMKDDAVDWVDMRVPDGHDYLEYMLNVKNPSVRTRGVMNHMSFGVPSVEAGYQTLVARKMQMGGEKPKIGRDGKWQLNLYDPDHTRAELMEPKPVEKPCCSPIVNP